MSKIEYEAWVSYIFHTGDPFKVARTKLANMSREEVRELRKKYHDTVSL